MLLQKPTPNELPILVAPVAEHMQAATAMTEGRRSTVFNHQKVVAESLHALSWMVYTGPNCGWSSHTHALNASVWLLETSHHLTSCFKLLSQPVATHKSFTKYHVGMASCKSLCVMLSKVVRALEFTGVRQIIKTFSHPATMHY